MEGIEDTVEEESKAKKNLDTYNTYILNHDEITNNLDPDNINIASEIGDVVNGELGEIGEIGEHGELGELGELREEAKIPNNRENLLFEDNNTNSIDEEKRTPMDTSINKRYTQISGKLNMLLTKNNIEDEICTNYNANDPLHKLIISIIWTPTVFYPRWRKNQR